MHVIKSLNQQNYAALAAAAGPNKRHTLLRLYDKVKVVKNECVRARGVGEANAFELDAAYERGGPVAAGDKTFVRFDVNGGRTLDDLNNFEGRSLCTCDGAKVGGGAAEEEGAGKYDLNGGGQVSSCNVKSDGKENVP